jgi:hypothetical protein
MMAQNVRVCAYHKEFNGNYKVKMDIMSSFPTKPLPSVFLSLSVASSKARRVKEEAEPKRVRSYSPSVANDYTLPAFTPNNPLGERRDTHIISMTMTCVHV